MCILPFEITASEIESSPMFYMGEKDGSWENLI